MHPSTPGWTIAVHTLVAAFVIIGSTAARAIAAPSAESPYGRRVSDVRVQPRWLYDGPVPLRAGETLTETNLSAALNAVKDAISARAERYGRAGGTALVTMTYVEPSFTLGDHGDVGVTLHPYYLALPVDGMGKLTLPVPRELPRGDRREAATLLPVELGLSSDRTIGTAADAGLKLNFGGGGKRPDPFSFRLTGQQSLENSFHSAHASLGAGLTRPAGWLRNLHAAADGSLALQPLGENQNRTRSGGFRTGVALAPERNSRLLVDTAYHQRHDRFEDHRGAAAVEDSPDAFSVRLLLDRIPPQALGFFRAALWHGVERSGGASTQRLIGRLGYAREWLLRPNQTIGVELVTGFGELWGSTPERRRFFGGTSAGSFVYDAPDAASLLEAPTGPLMRSFGRAQAGLIDAAGTVRGGTRFRHASVSISLPVPAWSRPLIPAEPVGIPGPDGRELTLKDMLRNQVDRSGPNMLASTLAESEHLSAAEAQRRAADVFSTIQPAAHYVIDRANVFAIKPLLLFDVATLETATLTQSWSAAGAGIQLIVVTAKLDAGYMRTLSGASRSNHNIFVRLGFERLF